LFGKSNCWRRICQVAVKTVMSVSITSSIGRHIASASRGLNYFNSRDTTKPQISSLKRYQFSKSFGQYIARSCNRHAMIHVPTPPKRRRESQKNKCPRRRCMMMMICNTIAFNSLVKSFELHKRTSKVEK